MFFSGLLSSLPLALLIFCVSLVIVVAASARFTRKLEELCERLNLSIGVLSLVSALGANIPNYVASALAILGGHEDVGIGIIIGSNIFNITIILGLCTLFTPERSGITRGGQQQRDVRVIAGYAIVITLLSLAVLFWLPGTPGVAALQASKLSPVFLPLTGVVVLVVFGALLVHIFRRSHGSAETSLHHHERVKRKTSLSLVRLVSEIIFTLVIALGSVLVMVQAGQVLTADLHLPSILAGLLVLAVATSLPNMVVALSLMRTGEAAASVEEIYSSGSINIALGMVLPLLFWQGALLDRFLLFLDGPLALALMMVILWSILKGRISRSMGIFLLGTYVAWVVVRFWV